jgi:predicted Zn-dependent protease
MAGTLLVVAVGALAVVDQYQVRRASRQVAIAIATGRYEDARAALASWQRRRPGAIGPLLAGCRLALLEGRSEDAVTAWNKAHDSGATGPEATLLGAALQVRAGSYREAEPVLRRAWDAAVFDPIVGEALARLYLETFRLGAAHDVLDRWAEAVPGDPRPWLWRVEVDSRLDDPAPVLRDYREALRRDPSLVRPRRDLAESLRTNGQPEEAAREFREYLRHRPDDAEAWLGLARVALARADRDEAARAIAKGLESDPENAALWSERGNLALARDDPESAWPDLERAARLDPQDPEARRRLALALGRLGRTAEAEAAVQEARRLSDEREEIRRIRDRLTERPDDREAQVAAARWLIDHDHAEEGLRWARKVLSEDPTNRETHALLADYYQERGEMGLANYHRMRLGEAR